MPMGCDHESGKGDWARLPNGVMKLHPCCSKCGTLKNVSSDRGEKMSYFIITLSKLRKVLRERGYKMSEAQIRLIARELSETEGFEDTWWITFSAQREIFIQTVRKYVRVPRDLLEAIV
ncbi:hypothetical protein [Geoglobus acetivorans]|uniref:Uncharacterized protein n=1 Tax=Geoglobus acetivorans TaxID=565033 RepID=A0ABZ3H361_GEOAI|nr:hypothetical protein [Geoglobus acetivorans]